jgi:hypothetical protein
LTRPGGLVDETRRARCQPLCIGARVAPLTLFVVCPHPKDLYDPFLFDDLVNESVLQVDATRVCPLKITDQLLVPGRRAKGILTQEGDQALCLCFQAGANQLDRILCASFEKTMV